ncbi:uncharacterized protein LOC130453034 [Diorhabda sublineata]|uniref:uncharacterized protein LOC130453034 n=1 Tax=Diorhabda sublineata TaxID=1163346 RepID=UPI0024E0E9CB|nr:uncharacterized protein LOC130453034 [Diorhabda sublineata]
MGSKFGDLLKALTKEQSSKSILKILSSIRKGVEWPKNKSNIDKIREMGSLKYFIINLNSRHKHIVDVSLSILGNACMDYNCARDLVGLYNIIHILSKILQRYTIEDSINGRIFRIIGNLCQHSDDLVKIILDQEPQILTQLLDTLKSTIQDISETHINYSEATIIMGLRALRYMISRQSLKKYQIVQTVGSLFFKISQEWQKNKSQENTLDAVINLLYKISKYKEYDTIIILKNLDCGNALEELPKVLLHNPSKIMSIIVNFIGISKFKSDLPVPEICTKFVDEVVRKHIDADTTEFSKESLEHIYYLCTLLDHPANRNGYNCAKTIPLLIQVLEKLKAPTDDHIKCSILLVSTLNKCQYEESLLQDQLKCNILDVIIKKMRWIINDTDIYSKHRFRKGFKRKSSTLIRKLQFEDADVQLLEDLERKRACTCLECVDENCTIYYSYSGLSPSIIAENRHRQLSPVSSDDEFSFMSSFKFDRSPSPCSSTNSDYAALTWTSPCSSPRSSKNDASSYSDSDDYSPVCSEADSTEFPVSDYLEEELDEDSQSDLSEIKEQIPVEKTLEHNSTTNLKMRLISEITKLIKSYVKIEPPVPQLASEELLIALINCSESFNSKQSTYITTINVACDILRSPLYLLPLMKTTFIEKIYKLTELAHTSRCIICVDHSCIGKMILKRITYLAECAAGKGDIAHELLRANNDVKVQLVLVIPYIIDDKKILSKLLINCGGLNILMKLLTEDSIYKQRTIKVICSLASRKLNIANPRKLAMDIGDNISVRVKTPDDPANIVTFKLDDGSCIEADRDVLIEKSDYFNSLLNGHFKEKNEEIIYLHNVEFKTLNCLLNLIKSNSSLDQVDVDTLLDVIVLSDRYLMNDICCFVRNYVEKHTFSFKTVPTIYKWSLESGLNLLRIECIAFALVTKLMDSSRFSMFDGLFELGYSNELVEDIRALLVRYLGTFSR